jgi:K+/H+ antiporter YhaU regulatory subunit KhtT
LANKTLAELKIRNQTGCNVIGYIPHDGRAIINPKAEQTLEDDGKLIVLGDTQALTELQRMFLAKSS